MATPVETLLLAQVASLATAGAWQNLTLGGSYSASGGTPQIRREGNRAFFSGGISGTFTTGTLFTVPAGFAPAMNGSTWLVFDLLSDVVGDYGKRLTVRVDSSGTCTIFVATSVPTMVHLDTINWPLT